MCVCTCFPGHHVIQIQCEQALSARGGSAPGQAPLLWFRGTRNLPLPLSLDVGPQEIRAGKPTFYYGETEPREGRSGSGLTAAPEVKSSSDFKG